MTLTLNQVSAYRCASFIDLYLHVKFHWNRSNFLWMDARTYGSTFVRLTLLGRLCRRVDLNINQLLRNLTHVLRSPCYATMHTGGSVLGMKCCRVISNTRSNMANWPRASAATGRLVDLQTCRDTNRLRPWRAQKGHWFEPTKHWQTRPRFHGQFCCWDRTTSSLTPVPSAHIIQHRNYAALNVFTHSGDWGLDL